MDRTRIGRPGLGCRSAEEEENAGTQSGQEHRPRMSTSAGAKAVKGAVERWRNSTSRRLPGGGQPPGNGGRWRRGPRKALGRDKPWHRRLWTHACGWGMAGRPGESTQGQEFIPSLLRGAPRGKAVACCRSSLHCPANNVDAAVRSRGPNPNAGFSDSFWPNARSV